MKKITLILMLAASVMGANSLKTNAQTMRPTFQFGVRAGLNLPYFTGDMDRTSIRPAYYAGLTVDYNMTSKLFIQSGVDFMVKGSKQKSMDQYAAWGRTETKYDPMYIQVPIHFGYRLLSTPVSVSLSGGPYIAYGVGGKVKTKDMNTGTMIETKDDFFKKRNFRRFDVGLGAKLSAEYQGFDLHFGCDFGVMDISRRRTIDGPKIEKVEVRNSNVYVGLGYKF